MIQSKALKWHKINKVQFKHPLYSIYHSSKDPLIRKSNIEFISLSAKIKQTIQIKYETILKAHLFTDFLFLVLLKGKCISLINVRLMGTPESFIHLLYSQPKY